MTLTLRLLVRSRSAAHPDPNGQTDGQTDGSDCITSHAIAVGRPN